MPEAAVVFLNDCGEGVDMKVEKIVAGHIFTEAYGKMWLCIVFFFCNI